MPAIHKASDRATITRELTKTYREGDRDATYEDLYVSRYCKVLDGSLVLGGKPIATNKYNIIAAQIVDELEFLSMDADTLVESMSALVAEAQAATPDAPAPDESIMDALNELGSKLINPIDEELFSSFTQCRDQHGKLMLAARTGRGQEYAAIGGDIDDIIAALPSVPAPEVGGTSSNMQQYAQRCLEFAHRVVNKGAFLTASDIQQLPASLANKYIKIKSNKQTGTIRLEWRNNTPPTVADWYKSAYQHWLGAHSHEYQSIVPASRTEDPTVPTWCYLDLAPKIIPGEMIFFDRWLRSCSSDEIEFDNFRRYICAWLYLVTLNRRCKQVLWFYDKGGSGKSDFIKAVCLFLGEYYTGSYDARQDGEHGSTQIVGKVLLHVSEQKNPNLLRTGMIQRITGGDTISINPKFQAIYTYAPVCQVVATENVIPSVSPYEFGQTSRVIFVPLLQRTKEEKTEAGIMHAGEVVGDSNFTHKMLAEMAAIMAQGKVYYEEMCPNGGVQLPVNAYMRAIMESQCVSSKDNQRFADARRLFVRSVNSYTPVMEVKEVAATVDGEIDMVDWAAILGHVFGDEEIRAVAHRINDHVVKCVKHIGLTAFGREVLDRKRNPENYAKADTPFGGVPNDHRLGPMPTPPPRNTARFVPRGI